MTQFSNADHQEITKFDNVSDIWWDPKGEMGTLHTINPLRTKFILDHIQTPQPRILDVGCGGGILSESLAQAGARVTGIDLSLPSLEVARQHARAGGLEIEYRPISAEAIAAEQPASFDAVTCLEMLEHVPEPQNVVAACARAVKPGGTVVFSTINRTLKALFAVILVGEYVLRLLPRGTHDYRKLIRPAELKAWAQQAGLDFVQSASLIYNPLTGKFKMAYNQEDMNYLVCFRKPSARPPVS
ncbi:MAG: bifunctional 2-polyprenyl-6-hydroxyphenol methylase/3-demethylubiquinol 3-O-methyltransferase UbiG [Anaerolineales bacterium]|nr:bifunctional 2-polyprenyl-6-hydroxyphenol methylase/3-demethylubiquinol 3-O-methyltransferase UbiG [Anaerolineales bacterium]